MLTRIISGVIGIGAAACVIQYGGWLFAIAVLMLVLIAWYEFSKAFAAKGIRVGYLTGAAMIFLLWGCSWLGNPEELFAITTLSALVLTAQAVIRYKKFSVPGALVTLGGVMYIGLSFSHLILLRFYGEGTMVASPLGDFDLGCAYVWTALIGTWASDTFAYFTGTAFGKHKLCPDISPKKSVEGFAGGIAGTMLSVAGPGVFFNFDVLMMAILGLFICLVATLGDLVESIMKRYTGIKDSGNIIPGHGGVWDRFDSVMFTVPFVYYFMQIAAVR